MMAKGNKEKKLSFTMQDLAKAAQQGLGTQIQDFGKRAYDAGADALGSVFDVADKNRIARLKADPKAQKEVKKLEANIQNRRLEDRQRNKDVAEIGLESQGKATRLESKDRIVKNLASNEVKAVKGIQSDLNKSVEQAINDRVKALRAAGEPEDKIQSWVAVQKSGAGNQIKQIAATESQASQAAINDLAKGGNVNPFAIDRANQQFDKLQGKEIDAKRAIRTSAPVETLARTLKEVSNFGNDVEILGATAIDQTLGRGINAIQGKGFAPTNLTKAALADVERAKQSGAKVGGLPYAEALDQDQSLGAQAQRFVGQSIPFMLAPETAVARRVSIGAAKLLRPGFLRNVLKTGVKDAVRDAPVSWLQTAGDLNRRVQTGEITAEEAWKQAPGELIANTAGDLFGGGLMHGAGRLLSRGAKNIPSGISGAFKSLDGLNTPQKGAIGNLEAPLKAVANAPNQTVVDLKSKIEEKKAALQERLNEVNGEKLLLSERSQKRVNKLEKEVKELELALQKYEPTEQATTLKGLDAKQKAQALAEQIKARQNDAQPPVLGSQTESILTAETPNTANNIPSDDQLRQRSPLPDSQLPSQPRTSQGIEPPQTKSQESAEPQTLNRVSNTNNNTVLDDLQRYKSLKQNRLVGNGESVTLNFANKEQKALYELGGKARNQKGFKGSAERTNTQERALIRDALKAHYRVDDAGLDDLVRQTKEAVSTQVKQSKTSNVILSDQIKRQEPSTAPRQETTQNIQPQIKTEGQTEPLSQLPGMSRTQTNQPSNLLSSESGLSNTDNIPRLLDNQDINVGTKTETPKNPAKIIKKIAPPQSAASKGLVEIWRGDKKLGSGYWNGKEYSGGRFYIDNKEFKNVELRKLSESFSIEGLQKGEIEYNGHKGYWNGKVYDGGVIYIGDKPITLDDTKEIKASSKPVEPQEATNSAKQKSLAELEYDFDRTNNEGGDGYNPFRRAVDAYVKGQDKWYKEEINNLQKNGWLPKEFEGIKLEEPKTKPVDVKAPTVKENSTVQTGIKKVVNPDGTERIARTLGDYKAVDFQEIARQPDKLNKLSDINKAIGKTDEEAIDVIADLAKEKKTLENTLVDLSEALETKLKQKGINPEAYSYKGIQLFPSKGKDTLALNIKGQKILNRYERMLDRLGLGERIAKSETNSLSVQTNIGKASNARIGVQNSIDDLAEQFIKSKGDLLKTEKQFKAAKDVFMSKTAPKLENGGLDHVWKNKKGDTAFHVARAKSEFEGEAKDLLAARREQLKNRQDTGRVVKGKAETKLKDAETGKAMTAANKKFKSVYQELQERLDNKTAENLATERNPDLSTHTQQSNKFIEDDLAQGKQPEPEIIQEAAENTKKLNKQFAFNPAAIPVIGAIAKKIIDGNGFADTLELALNIMPANKMLDKFTKDAKFSNMKDAALELVFNTPKTIDQAILSVKRPANQKFIDGFNKLEARKMLYETRLADQSEEVYKEIQDILTKRNVDDILDQDGNIRPEFENSKAAEALAELADRKREMVEYAEDFKDDLTDKLNTLNSKIDRLEAQGKSSTNARAIKELKAEKLDLEKTLVAVDNKIGALKTITGSGLFQGVQSLAYKGALMWNPSSAFLNLFDYMNVRSAPELQASKGLARLTNTIPFFGDVDKALYQTLGQKLQKNENSLLHFMTSDKRGSYYNLMSNASQSRKAGKNVGEWLKLGWQKIQDADPNKVIADFYHDVTVVASARSWVAEHPEFKNLPDPVTNFRAFRDKAPKEAVLSFMTKVNIDMGLIAGRGAKGADFALGGLGNTELGKAFTPFLKPVYRISNSLKRASTDMLDGLNGFKKLDNGTYEFDINKVDSDKALRGVSSLIANVSGAYLIGGSTALVGLPGIGMAMNFLTRTFVPEDEVEEWKDNFNKFSLASKKLLPGFGERVQIQQRGLGEKDSVVAMLKNRFKTLGQPLLATYINDIGKTMEMTYKALEGEEAVDEQKLKKAWLKLLPAGQLANKLDAYFNDREKKVYDLDGAFPKEIGSVGTKGDWRLLVGGGNEEIENIKQSEKFKQRAKSNLANLSFTGKAGRLKPTFSREGLQRFKSDVNRYMALNPNADRNEVESKLIAAAKKKWLDKHPEMKKQAKPKRYKAVTYLLEEEES